MRRNFVLLVLWALFAGACERPGYLQLRFKVNEADGRRFSSFTVEHVTVEIRDGDAGDCHQDAPRDRFAEDFGAGREFRHPETSDREWFSLNIAPGDPRYACASIVVKAKGSLTLEGTDTPYPTTLSGFACLAGAVGTRQAFDILLAEPPVCAARCTGPQCDPPVAPAGAVDMAP